MQLSPPTQALSAGKTAGSPSQAPTLAVEDDDDAAAGNGLITGLAVVGFVAACALLAFQLMIAGIWINADDNESLSGWMQLLE